jgi:O-antigen ligase
VLAVLEAVRILPGEFPRWETNYNRAALGFGQPNGLGLFFAVTIPFAVHRFRIERDGLVRVLCGLAFVCLAAGLIATFSRGSWLAVLAGTGALFFTGDGRFLGRIWLGALVLVVVVDVVTGGAMRDTVTRTIGDWVIEQRAALMLAGVQMFFAYPLTGVGPGGYAESLDQFGPQLPQLWDYLPTPHNAYVQMAAEIGILGLLAFVLLLAVTLRMQVRRTRREDHDPSVTPAERSLNRALLWSFATACAVCMVVWPFAHGTGQAVMLVAAGIFARPRRPHFAPLVAPAVAPSASVLTSSAPRLRS